MSYLENVYVISFMTEQEPLCGLGFPIYNSYYLNKNPLPEEVKFGLLNKRKLLKPHKAYLLSVSYYVPDPFNQTRWVNDNELNISQSQTNDEIFENHCQSFFPN